MTVKVSHGGHGPLEQEPPAPGRLRSNAITPSCRGIEAPGDLHSAVPGWERRVSMRDAPQEMLLTAGHKRRGSIRQ